MQHHGLLPILACLLLIAGAALAYDNGVGSLPPMGWNTWCTDDDCGKKDRCSEDEIKQEALAMISTGMYKLGYEYINMDDCWVANERDENGNLQPNSTRFPSGMKAVADYLHSLGLKFGLYTSIGSHTCENNLPGSFGHFKEDAEQFASWDMDFIKCDNCNRPTEYSEKELFTNFSHWLNATGHTMLFSTCEWGAEDIQTWGFDIAQMFRIQEDHLPYWTDPAHSGGMGTGHGLLDIIDYVATVKPATFVKQFGWMDPDFLMTLFTSSDGSKVVTYTESQTELSLWSLWAAPLICATDLVNMTDQKKSILLNDEIIAVDRDPSYSAGDRIYNNTDGTELWARPLYNGDIAFVLFNGGNSTHSIPASLTDVGFKADSVVSLRDLWAHSTLGNFTGTSSYTTTVDAHGVAMLRGSCVANC